MILFPIPHCCPVCLGAQFMHASFYDPLYECDPTIDRGNIVPCQSCLATGVITTMPVVVESPLTRPETQRGVKPPDTSYDEFKPENRIGGEFSDN